MKANKQTKYQTAKESQDKRVRTNGQFKALPKGPPSTDAAIELHQRQRRLGDRPTNGYTNNRGTEVGTKPKWAEASL